MKKAIFFDLDGTLWDALVPLTDSWNKAMIDNKTNYRFNVPLMKSFMGLTPEETLPLAFPGTSKEEGMKLFQICLKSELEFLAIHPGVLYPNEIEILSILKKKYPLYIVSNSDKGYIENYLEACKMVSFFEGHLCAGDTGLAKWQNIKKLQHDENIDEVIYIGDTKKDMVESDKAGAIFIHASYGFGKIENTKYKILSLDELPQLIDKIF